MPVSLLASTFNFREQPAGATAKRTKLAPSFNNQERIAGNCAARGTAAFATANWQPYQNFALAEAYGTGIWHRLTFTASASLW